MEKRKVAVINIGNAYQNSLLDVFENFEVVNFFDKKLDCIKSDGESVFSYDEEKSFIERFLAIMPVDSVIIKPSVKIGKAEIVSSLQMLLNNIFWVIKQIYSPVMMHRGTKVWVLEPDILCLNENNEQNRAYIRVFNQGIKNLTKVTAIELAKKKIAVNYFEGRQNAEGFEKLRSLIEWTNECKNTYLTAQELCCL